VADRKAELRTELRVLNTIERNVAKLADAEARVRVLEYHLNRARAEASARGDGVTTIVQRG
jgi:hypothetical protein